MNRRLLKRGTVDHYDDPYLYDHEYKRRRDDVNFYRRLADQIGGPILELGCGSGRIAAPLARDGHEVIGVDSHPIMLQRAEERRERLPKSARGRLKLLCGDLQTISLDKKFPLIISAFNTLQHIYTGEAMIKALRNIKSHMSHEGRFAFDVLMPDMDWLMRDPEKRWAKRKFKHPVTGEYLVYSTNHDYDPIAQIAYVRLFYDPPEGVKGPSRVVHLAHRQFFPQELWLLIGASGLVIERAEGDFDGRALSAISESQVYICQHAII